MTEAQPGEPRQLLPIAAAGCTECSAEPGEPHRWLGCPGAITSAAAGDMRWRPAEQRVRADARKLATTLAEVAAVTATSAEDAARAVNALDEAHHRAEAQQLTNDVAAKLTAAGYSTTGNIRGDVDLLLNELDASRHIWQTLQAQLAEARATGTPGVIHPTDKAFYNLAVKERDYERIRGNRLAADLATAVVRADRLATDFGAEVDWQNTIAARMPDTYDADEPQTAIIDRWLNDITTNIGPLAPAEWAEFRMRGDDDLLQCCGTTSAMRDAIFHLLRNGGEPDAGRGTFAVAYVEMLNHGLPDGRGGELLTRLRDYYLPGQTDDELRARVDRMRELEADRA